MICFQSAGVHRLSKTTRTNLSPRITVRAGSTLEIDIPDIALLALGIPDEHTMDGRPGAVLAVDHLLPSQHISSHRLFLQRCR